MSSCWWGPSDLRDPPDPTDEVERQSANSTFVIDFALAEEALPVRGRELGTTVSDDDGRDRIR